MSPSTDNAPVTHGDAAAEAPAPNAQRRPTGVVLIGATGSIGQSTQRVLRQLGDVLRLVGIASGQNREGLAAIAEEFSVPQQVLAADEGEAGLRRLATLPEADTIVMAATGTVGVRACIDALEVGKTLALASKEVMVVAGPFLKAAARRGGGRILPVDSEHNALFQCLDQGPGQPQRPYRRLLLTASGGPFRSWPLKQLAEVNPAAALRHPTWVMGPKVTIDSATMANKGLELMEAQHLFDALPQQLEVVIHPQSLAHGLVEQADGALLALLSQPDMAFPIQHALCYPSPPQQPIRFLDFSAPQRLEFLPPDYARYPCLRLAREAMAAGDSAPAAFHAANAVAVEAFLKEALAYLAIPALIEDVLAQMSQQPVHSLDDALAAEAEARARALHRLSYHA